MKKKNLALALVLMVTLTIVSTLATGRFDTRPIVAWLIPKTEAKPSAIPVANRLTNLQHDQSDYPTSGTFSDTLGNPQVSVHQDGDTIIVMTARGELPGTLTLKFHKDADGSITEGEWAFNVSYTEVQEIEPEVPGGEDHSEFLIQRGTLKGTISGGTAALNGEGSISSISSVQLRVNGGSLEFYSTSSGVGNGQVTNLQDASASSGTLTLSF